MFWTASVIANKGLKDGKTGRHKDSIDMAATWE